MDEAKAVWRDLDPLEARIENEEQLPYDVPWPALRELGPSGCWSRRSTAGPG